MDIDVKYSLDWLRSFLSDQEWDRRKLKIEEYLETLYVPYVNHENAPTSLHPIAINDDKIGWYLYLAEQYLYQPYSYETIQGSRVIPIFKNMGRYRESLKNIKGIDDRVLRMVSSERGNPDSGLFEILTALLYAKNSWKYVELIPENNASKTPDIKIWNRKGEWFVECKRLSKSSDSSLREREKWLVMWKHLSDLLVNEKYPYFFDIDFHVDLNTLPDDFMVTQLQEKLKLLVPPGVIISNETWDVRVRTVNLYRFKNHLRNYSVKVPSWQLDELISDRRNSNRGVTYVYYGQHERIGKGKGINYYLSDIGFAAGCCWDCDSEEVQKRKARDIRGHLSEAVSQLPDGQNGIVHIGMETLDGWIVEKNRYERIVNTVKRFDARGKRLSWIFCHLFQPYAPPEAEWVYDETVYFFSFLDKNNEISDSLANFFLVTPDDGIIREGVHWDPERDVNSEVQ